jgi:hypothetical protein
MDSNQAYDIVQRYDGVPRTRAEQEELIRSVYPQGHLHHRPLSQCRDQQIYRVAERLYEEAHAIIREDREEIRAEWIARCEEEYARHLFEIFNIPPSEWEDTDPADLEALLRE